MSERNAIEPLDDELANAFAAERASSDEIGADDASKARVWDRVQSVALASTAATSVATTSTVVERAKQAAHFASVSLATKVVRTALVLALGAGVGVGVDRAIVRSTSATHDERVPSHATHATREQAQVPEAVPAPIAAPPIEASVETTPPAVEEHLATSPRNALPANRDRTAPTRERTVIDIARTAIARNRYDAARDAIRQHEAQFPRGSLVEEREALKVFLVIRTESPEAARRAASRFRARFPHSLFHDPINAALTPR